MIQITRRSEYQKTQNTQKTLNFRISDHPSIPSILSVRAFTLIEVMIAVAIVAMLAILAIGIFTKQIAKGRDAKRKADLNRIGIALEEYEKDKNCFPKAASCSNPKSLKPYLNAIPCDPKKISYGYDYEPVACPTWYRLYAKLENTDDKSVIPDIGPSKAYNYYSGSANSPNPI
jgi:prepilin-type N-terminal cleavage/methylation domain-containing protein